MRMKTKIRTNLLLIIMLFAISLSGCKQHTKNTIRIGYFPNLTHPQAVYGYANGNFQKVFGEQYDVKLVSFNSGPAEIEAMFAGEIDIGYIGPIPAINGYVKSNGDVKIIAGAALNGASLIKRNNSHINSIKDLAGHTIAVPQFGNTQHLCLLNLLSTNNLSTVEKGGNIKIVESSNPDIKTLMDKRDIDAALIPEPWATQLVNEIDAEILLSNDQLCGPENYTTTVVVANTKFYENNKNLVMKFLKTHVELTEYINSAPEDAMIKINDKIGTLTGSKLNTSILKNAFSNLIATYDPNISSINSFIEVYQKENFLENIPYKNNIYDFNILNEVLKEKKLPEISVTP